MTFDSTTRVVQLTITTRYDESHGGFNLNGGYAGNHRITVPLGWTVHISFINRDVIEHSLGLVKDDGHPPTRVARPAFPGAASRSLGAGIPAGGRDDAISFVARAAGSYLLACGVPGHAALGGYLRFVVSADARVPTYTISSSRPVVLQPPARHEHHEHHRVPRT